MVNQFQTSCCVWVVSEHVFSLPCLLLLNFGFCFSGCGQGEEETKLRKSVMSTPEVKAQRYSPCLGPWDLVEGLWIQPHWCAGESPPGRLSMNLSSTCLEVATTSWSGLPWCSRNKRRVCCPHTIHPAWCGGGCRFTLAILIYLIDSLTPCSHQQQSTCWTTLTIRELKVGVNQQPLVHPPLEACFNTQLSLNSNWVNIGFCLGNLSCKSPVGGWDLPWKLILQSPVGR
jgi:hypothetical protein